MEFKEQLKLYSEMAAERISEVFSEKDCLQKTVYDAMSYSILAGGKRIRPVLALSVCDMLGGEVCDALRFAVAIECIHTYSLIHDDLPCMDNDDLRRGKPTCHKQFDEAMALLAGDGLLTFAFEYMTDLSGYKNMSPVSVLKAANMIAVGAGCDGMIGGQVVDLECEGKTDVDEKTLTYLHNRKTGALIRVSALSGAIAAGADAEQIAAITKYADCIGLAFQIQDDVLDCTGDTEVLGKPIGSDAENEKVTYVTLLGVEKAKKSAQQLTEAAIAALDIFGSKADFLKELALYLQSRNN